jgi:hypothetical protein
MDFDCADGHHKRSLFVGLLVPSHDEPDYVAITSTLLNYDPPTGYYFTSCQLERLGDEKHIFSEYVISKELEYSGSNRAPLN